jgi:hypothetical protein
MPGKEKIGTARLVKNDQNCLKPRSGAGCRQTPGKTSEIRFEAWKGFLIIALGWSRSDLPRVADIE